MARRIATFILAMVVLPSFALAHGPTRQKASESIIIDAAPEDVWAVLSDFGDMSWHPRVAGVAATAGSEKGSVRTIEYQSGETMEEELSNIQPDRMRLSTFVGHVNLEVIPATNYSSNMTVAPVENGEGTEVTWSSAFYRGYPNNDPPAELNEEAAITGVTAYMTEGLEGLKEAVEAGS